MPMHQSQHPHFCYVYLSNMRGQRADALADWREFTSPEGRKYYYNKATRMSQWRMPDEVKVVVDLNPIWNVKKDVVVTKIRDTTPSDEKTVELGPLVYKSKAEAKSAFKTLLESANTGSDCTWDQAMRVVINDQRYGALKFLCERKQAFNEYLSQKKKLEAEERRVKQKKTSGRYQDNVRRLQGAVTIVKIEVCLSLVIKEISIFEHDESFKAVERAKAREEIFEDYVEELEKKASSQWQKVQDRLETDERCSLLEKIDRLEIFQEYIRDLESEEEDQRKLRMKTVCMMVDDVLVVVGGSVICDGVIVVSTDTVVSVADGSGRGGDAGDSGGDVVVLDLIDELVGSRDRPIAIDGGGVGDWRMLDDFKVAIAKYITYPPMSDTNLKVLHKMSGLSAKSLVVLPCYVSLEVGQFVIDKLATRRYLSVPVLILTIRRLTKEKIQMASKVSSMLRNQVAERASAKK
ncbi:Pre-mRNA-processing protein 40B [Capsicum baccatum]|uniref:Pre-mRNA-processing protein 40B n=1 Tax=Capsicum baccatum TaxID=33114 RepID=A0A2G2V4B5_CAPBA|nr:Pre-mRNA-processing protein 40B [Capsicum baccatum]